MKKIILLTLIGSSALLGYGQDARMSQFWTNGMRMNPGLIGKGIEKGQYRITSGYRNQWSSLQVPFNSMTLAFEKPMTGENSSMGLFVNRDIAGSGKYQSLSINGVYGYQVKLNPNTVAQFGLQLAYQHSSLDRTDMRFLDGIDPMLGYMGSQETIPFVQKGYVNTAVGGSLQGRVGEFGIAIHNVNQPKYSFYSNSDNLIPRKYTAHASFNIGSDENMQLRPTIVAMKQGEFSDLSAGLSYYLSGFNMHGYYRRSFLNQGNADALSFGIGITANSIQLGYSYDMTLSALKDDMPVSHELSLRIQFGKEQGNSSIAKESITLSLFPPNHMVEVKSLADIKRVGADHDPAMLQIPSLGDEVAAAGFYLSVGLSTSEAEADEQIRTLLKQDIKAFKMKDPTSGNYYLYVDYFKSENQARESLLDLEQTVPQVWIREVN